MSSAGCMIVCLLLIIPFYDAAEIQERSVRRYRRSLMNLKTMVKAVTGREGSDFIGYGNWCGLGGSGSPVDPIDKCCEVHDICYDLARDGPCRKEGEKAVYQIEYKWKTSEDGQAFCLLDEDKCKATICMCDSVISNCLKRNIESYDDQNLHKLNLFEMIREADWLTSS